MNERIEQLARECWSTSEYDTSLDPWFNHRKFAKLMVEEFQSILRDNRGEDTGTLSYRVEEHFRS